jgi:hypothetical protein
MEVARIKFNGTPYMLPVGHHSGNNLRAFFGVKKSHHLYGERDKDDAMISEDDAEILVEDGARFYSASKKINQS